ARQSDDDLRRLKTISRRRQAILPIAALVFERVLKVARPARVAFSAFGLREGRLFAAMDEGTRAVDPLLAGCGDLALRSGRGHHDPERLFEWVRPLFDPLSTGDARLLRAVCVLSDIAWAGYPGHRGEQAFLRALHLPIAGLGHGERVTLAMALHARYAGHLESPLVRSVSDLISPDRRVWANSVGRALRFGLTLCAGRVDVLARTYFVVNGRETAHLVMPDDLKDMVGENIERRLIDVASILDRKMTIHYQAMARR
ncbi:MAG: Ppx/GppA family phosphatase, partial [Thalassobaculaceae bacterium]